METVQLKVCPNCKSKDIEKVFKEIEYDNDLHEFYTSNELSKKYSSLNFEELSKSCFCICKNCLLVFSTNRRKEENMYSMDFFADVQKRWYAQLPVPQRYIDYHKEFSKNFIAILKKNQFRLSLDPKILWLRPECGIATMDLLKNVNKDNVYMLEYFESNIRFLKDNGYKNVKKLPPGDFVSSFEELKFTEIFVNHQLTHSFSPLKLMRTILDMLDDNGKVIFYNEIDHIEANKMKNHYPRGINNFHNQLFTKNSMINFLETCNANVEFFESVPPQKNASVHAGMFGVITKNRPTNKKVKYINSIDIFNAELYSFTNWMNAHTKFSQNLKLKKFFQRLSPVLNIKIILKFILKKLKIIN